jgi:hypothetical protein
MQLAIQVCGYVVGLPLELLVIAALLRGDYLRFPFLFVYVVADFLTTVIEIRPSLNYGTRTPQAVREWAFIYWADERIMQTLMFLLVISLIYLAAADLRPRRAVLAIVICGTLLFAGISLLVHYDPNTVPGKWMTPWTRDLNFGAAILNLGLWAMLIRPGRRDYRVLMLSGALGIQFAGQAIAQSLRNLGQSPANRSTTLVLVGNILNMVANLACLYMWWQALRTAPAMAGKRAAGAAGNRPG